MSWFAVCDCGPYPDYTRLLFVIVPVITCWVRTGLLALLCVMFSCGFVTFLFGSRSGMILDEWVCIKYVADTNSLHVTIDSLPVLWCWRTLLCICFIDGHIYDLFKNCTRVSVVILSESRFLYLRNMPSHYDLDFRVVQLKDLLYTLLLKVGRVYEFIIGPGGP